MAKNANQVLGIPPELVENFVVEAKIDGDWKEVASVKDNIRRYVPVQFEAVKTKALRVRMTDTHGAETVKVFELRCY